MGNTSSRTVDSVSKEMNETIQKLKDDKKRLERFIQYRKKTATDEWSEDKESEDKEQMRLTGELVALKTRLTELNKELDGLLQSASASPAAGSGTGSGSNSPAATSVNRPDTQPNSNARNALGPQDPNLTGFEFPSFPLLAHPSFAVLAPAAAAASFNTPNPPAAAAFFNTPNTPPNIQHIYNRNAPGPQDPNQPDLTGFEYNGGKIKRKNSKRKNSKRKNSKRKNSKRKNSKRKNSKSK